MPRDDEPLDETAELSFDRVTQPPRPSYPLLRDSCAPGYEAGLDPVYPDPIVIDDVHTADTRPVIALVPALTVASAEGYGLTGRALLVARSVDGRRTVEQIGLLCGARTDEVDRELEGLARRGLVVYTARS